MLQNMGTKQRNPVLKYFTLRATGGTVNGLGRLSQGEGIPAIVVSLLAGDGFEFKEKCNLPAQALELGGKCEESHIACGCIICGTVRGTFFCGLRLRLGVRHL